MFSRSATRQLESVTGGVSPSPYSLASRRNRRDHLQQEQPIGQFNQLFQNPCDGSLDVTVINTLSTRPVLMEAERMAGASALEIHHFVSHGLCHLRWPSSSGRR